MISILIPTYNYNAYTLVKELHSQLITTAIKFEIICIDDGSKSDLNLENQKINRLSFSDFIIADCNLGRSAVRNLLSKKATYNWLLFLDADVFPTNKNFVAEYLNNIQSKNMISCGGISYKKDNLKKNLLRYKYGKKYEEISVSQRNLKPYKFFLTSNFLIHKTVFNKIHFDEKLINYGYEDLLFSKALKAKNVKVLHIENEVYHLGIDANVIFIRKTKEALNNLVFLLSENEIQFQDTSLTAFLSKYKFLGLLRFFSNFFENITEKRGALFFFNLFRIAYLSSLSKKL